MSKSTFGPWKVVADNRNVLVVAENTNEIICHLGTDEFCATDSDALQDAHLIAAAPTLLAAALQAWDLLRGSGFVENTPTLAALRDAINKAEGSTWVAPNRGLEIKVTRIEEIKEGIREEVENDLCSPPFRKDDE